MGVRIPLPVTEADFCSYTEFDLTVNSGLINPPVEKKGKTERNDPNPNQTKPKIFTSANISL